MYDPSKLVKVPLFLWRLFRRYSAHVHSFMQHVIDVLDCFVFGVYFPQRVAYDT